MDRDRLVRRRIAVAVAVTAAALPLLDPPSPPHVAAVPLTVANRMPTTAPAAASRDDDRKPLAPRVVPPAPRPLVGHPEPATPRPAPKNLAPSPGRLLQVTAYCATGSPNAAGHMPRIGEAAGNRWPLGTRLSVPGYGTVLVEDRIGYGSDVDLFMGGGAACERAADAWGRRTLAVTVVSPGA